MSLRVGFLMGILLFALVAPHASAQAGCTALPASCETTVSVSISPPTQPVKPLGAFIALPVTIQYSFSPSAGAIAPTPITLSVSSAPPWAVATLSPTTVFAEVTAVGQGAAQQNSPPLNSFLLISATQDAPAFTNGIIEVTASAAANGNLVAKTGTVQVPIQADFFSIIEVTTPSTIQKAKPQAQVLFPLTVTNFGNAQTKVEFIPDSVPDKWQVVIPAPITLNARQAGQAQNTKTVNLNVQTPFQNGYMNVVGAITVRLRSTYALDPKVIGDSTLISTLTTTKGFYVPGPEPILALAGIAAVALALNQRDERKRR